MAEELELLKLRAKAKAKAAREREVEVEQPAQEFQAGLAPEVEGSGLSPRDRALIDPSDVETVSDAALGAVEGLPFAKDVIAGAQALTDEDADFGEAYQRNKRNLDTAINDAEERSPTAFMVGDVGSGFVVPALKSVKGAMILGGLSSVSRLEDRNPYDAAVAASSGVVLGGAFGKLGEGITKGVAFVGSKLGLVATKAGSEALNGGNKSLLRDMNRHVDKFYKKKGMSQTEATIAFSESIMNKSIDGEPFLARAQSFDRTMEKAGQLKAQFGKKIGSVLNEIEEIAEPVSGQNLYNTVRTKLGIAAKEMSDNGDTVAEAVAMDRLLKETFFETIETGQEKVTREVVSKLVDHQGSPIITKVEEFVPVTKLTAKAFSPKRMFALKQDIAKSGAATRGFESLAKGTDKSKLSLAQDVDTARINALSQEIESMVDNLAEDSIANFSRGSFKELNRDWASMHMIEGISKKAMENAGDGPVGRLRRLMGARGLLLAGVIQKTGANGAVAMVASGVLNEVINDPRTVASMAVGMRKLSDKLATDPNSPYLKRLMVAGAISSDALREALPAMVGELNLLESAVARTAEDAIMKSDSILPIIQEIDPQIADQLRGAIERGETETIGQVMDQVSKLPEAKKFFEPGMGFDGKVYDEADKAQLTSQVMNSNINRLQKIKHKKEISVNGIIPKIEQPEPKFFEWKQRNKEEPEY